MYKRLLLGAAAMLIPASISADVVVSEIMYDVDGTDTDKEWVEIYNRGGEAVDMTGWKINDGSNHVLNAPPKNGSKGSMTVSAGGYLVLAADAAVFSNTYGSVGNVIDTALSLNNTGDTISLIDAEGVTVDTISYTKDMGAAGDGNSLHREGSALTPGAPSPESGAVPAAIPPEDTSSSENASSKEKTESTQKSASTATAPPQLTTSAGKDRSVIAGADSAFEAQAYNEKKESVDARFVWNFGDGMVGEGKSVAHTFQYAGRYVVALEATYSALKASHQVVVEVAAANLALSLLSDGGVAIKNDMSRDIDLSRWFLRESGKSFTIPVNTTLLKGATLRFSESTLGFKAGTYTELLYPNGTHAFSVGEEIKTETKTVAAPPSPKKKSVPAKSSALADDRPTDLQVEDPSREEETVEKESQVAAAASFWEGGSIWWGGVLLIVLFGGGAAYAIRRVGMKEWNIIEETEDTV